jgi:hypothetical protein
VLSPAFRGLVNAGVATGVTAIGAAAAATTTGIQALGAATVTGAAARPQSNFALPPGNSSGYRLRSRPATECSREA